MSTQTISGGFWQIQLPEDWIHKPGHLDGCVYFESPDNSAGVYVSAWRTAGQPLRSAIHDAQAVFRRNLPTAGEGVWEVLKEREDVSEDRIDVVAEYFNRNKSYRIESRIVGSAEHYAILNYHDYDCRDPGKSAVHSSPWVESLVLRDETENEP